MQKRMQQKATQDPKANEASTDARISFANQSCSSTKTMLSSSMAGIKVLTD
eukprot:TRINITY_DN7201_c0_g1_i1.p3 TRINITY_DN7201_c0_g1~~TRINITY_DN7201_c0_g1_i1.p3  ORF type:complete len:51 (+),score=4.59 TRINITY_DN7201_c0_g1_i1:425-577(+)